MNVPLSATPVSYGGIEKLKIWYNGKQTIVDTKIKPYFYSYNDLHIGVKKSVVNAIALSTYQKKQFFKYEFNTRKELYEQNRSGITFEGSISEGILYVIRNRIDIPDLFTRFPNSNDLKFLFFDIEQYTKPNKMFPTYDDRLISIAYCTNDRRIKTICLKKTTPTDKELLEKFIEEYEKINPDVLVVYNKTYDIPTLINRCVANGINTTSFSKNKTKPFLNRRNVAFIDGVVTYDVYDSARDDQTLTGNVENRGLKAVSDYFDFKGEREPLEAKNISKYIGTQELIDYNKDDVKRLVWLFDIYWPGIKYTADDLRVPLNLALDMSITKLGLIVMGDEYKKRNIIADGRNYDRYPEIFQRKKKTGEANYEGGLVGISRTGTFAPVYKADYSSLYPKIMSEFNLSPDTTTLLMFEPYGEFKIVEEENAFIYHIPDDVLKKTMVIQVLKKPGFSALLVKKFLDERAEEKALFKETGDKKHETKSNNSKVKANGGVYGNQGSANHPYGFAPIAVATCGIGRECAQLLIDVLNKLYPNSVIEWDSDGVYFTIDTTIFNKNIIIKEFNKQLKQKFGKDLNLTIDIDGYDAGYFYKAKNYLLKKGNKIIYHGVAMKARSKDNLSKNLIQELAEAKLNNKPILTIMKKYKKLDFPLKDFAMNVTMGMPLFQYKNKNSLAPRLAIHAEKKLGIKIQPGNQYYYVKEKDDYELLELTSLEKIDKQYYMDQVIRILKMFDTTLIVDDIDRCL